ncbi:MAG: hypothetical protein HOD43_11955 [Candidatus Marinimicrobia bacterium]|jgi:hypothetical protein|nr:hypothetical protein [Candidatus Neomarinimicrobiota bacterium]MBT3631778.1 hypothetical protein [Candidatus Neomarinimicrobiota bacterium]MBT3825498.1 hypothetical protein [Candidatus Neomarinimicrobiota bacterium]MBT4132225.1 hypothetical protein [Candidatus Neomarinimicrobiota bacterium]MBT4296502.1 hypothetical protein [Candidatus Neomarinimicrobiota bacterium]
MEIISIIVAALAFITGALLVVSPGLLIRAGEIFNQSYDVESMVYSMRKPFGAAFILLGLVFIWLTA